VATVGVAVEGETAAIVPGARVPAGDGVSRAGRPGEAGGVSSGGASVRRPTEGSDGADRLGAGSVAATRDEDGRGDAGGATDMTDTQAAASRTAPSATPRRPIA
jgi:hypothetical protein